MLMLSNPTTETWKQVNRRRAKGRRLMRMKKADLLVYAEEHDCAMEPEATKGEIVEELLFEEFGF